MVFPLFSCHTATFFLFLYESQCLYGKLKKKKKEVLRGHFNASYYCYYARGLEQRWSENKLWAAPLSFSHTILPKKILLQGKKGDFTQHTQLFWERANDVFLKNGREVKTERRKREINIQEAIPAFTTKVVRMAGKGPEQVFFYKKAPSLFPAQAIGNKQISGGKSGN